MADYKLVNTTKLDAGMTATADKIRAGTGKTDKITWKEENGFADDIPEGVEQATPSIDVDSEGKITASSTQGAGIVKSGTHESTKQLESQAAKTERSFSSATVWHFDVKKLEAYICASFRYLQKALKSLCPMNLERTSRVATRGVGFRLTYPQSLFRVEDDICSPI